MPVNYKSVPKGQPGVAGGGNIKYHAAIVRGQKIDVRTFVEDIAEMNTLNTSDIFAVLEAFFKRTNRYLSEGKSIDMGQFGTFVPYINSTGVETPEAVGRNSINRYRISFRPSPILQKQLKYVEFKKLTNGSTTEEV